MERKNYLVEKLSAGEMSFLKQIIINERRKYIRNNFDDIKKHANIIENRLDDSWCTMESVLADNANMLEFAKNNNVNCILVEDKYAIDIEL